MLAYRMEEGLKKFHEAFQAKTDDAALRALLTGLIKAEESHEKTLLELRESILGAGISEPGSPAGSDP